MTFRKLRGALTRLLGLLTRTGDEARMREEMDWHLEQRAQRFLADGLSPDEARRRAAMAFGRRAAHEEAARAQLRNTVIESALRDLSNSLRRLRQQPRFTVVAIATVGFVVGASAIMSRAHEHLLPPSRLDIANAPRAHPRVFLFERSSVVRPVVGR